jgi:hypothetical protein
MSKVIITFRDVLELNKLLEEKNISGKIHIHDGCGGQNFTFENTGRDESTEFYEIVREEITDFFTKKRIMVNFIGKEADFILKKIS